jgi:hypothetical protein
MDTEIETAVLVLIKSAKNTLRIPLIPLFTETPPHKRDPGISGV